MNDTPQYIQQKQFEIIFAKPLKDKLNGLFEMTELSRKIIQSRIQAERPDISDTDLKIEMFKAFYRFDYDPETLNRIAENMRQYWIKKL